VASGPAPLRERAPQLSGALVPFGNYDLILHLGQGGMADVFVAVYSNQVAQGFNKLVVIKRLRPSLAEEPEYIDMLLDEARLAARLNHPNIVQTNEVGRVGDEYFIAMEYLDGQSLHRIIHHANHARQKEARPAIPPRIGLTLICEALAGLHEAHELPDYDGTPLNIVHRDVSPHNLFVTYTGQVKLLDFGVAKAAGRGTETRQGVVKGKLAYMAPEQPTGTRPDRRADIFSVGVVLWEIVTGARMWQGVDDIAIFHRLKAKNIPRSPMALNPSVPTEIDRICRRALAPDPSERFATAAEFQSELEGYLRAENLYASPRELGDFVANLFANSRRRTRVIIDAQLANLSSRNGPSARPSEPISALPQSEHEPDGMATLTAEPSIDIGPRRSRAKSIIVASVLLIVASMAMVVLVRRAPPRDDAGPRGPGSAAPAPQRILLKVRATPPEAKLTLDGAPLPSNPVRQAFLRDGASHALRAEAEGYEPALREVVFDSAEQNVELTLTAAKATPTPAPSAPVLKRQAAPARSRPPRAGT